MTKAKRDICEIVGLSFLSFGAIWYASQHVAKRFSIDSGSPLPLWFAGIFALFSAILSIAVLYMVKKSTPVERIFLIVGTISAFLMCAALPIGTVPDEPAHILASYRLANMQSWTGEAAAPSNLLDRIGPSETLRDQTQNGFFSERLGEPTVIPGNEGTGIYPPLSYAPQAIGMSFICLFTDLRAAFLYGGRMMNIILFIILGYCSIRLIPFGKEILFAILLLPLTLQEAASFSVDGMTIVGITLLFAMVLHCRYAEGQMLLRQKLLLAVLACCTVLWKVMYVPTVFTLCLIPGIKWGSKKKKIIWLSAIYALVVLCLLIWVMQSVWEQVDHHGLTSNAVSRISGVLMDPLPFFKAFLNTLRIRMIPHIAGLFNNFGALDIHANLLIQILFILMFVSVVITGDHLQRIPQDKKWNTQLVLLLIACTIVLIMHVSLYIWWTAPEAEIIEGIQARYFLPIAPFIAVILPNISFFKKRKEISRLCVALVPIHTITAIVNILTVTIG